MAPKRPLGDVVREQEKKRPKRTVLAVKQPLGAVVPEQEAAWPPRKRLKRTVLVVMWLLGGSAAPRRERKKKVVSSTSSLFGVIFAEQEAARSPRKRLKRTVLVVMWLLEGSAAPRRERKKKVVSPTSSLFGVSSEPTFVPLDLLREITDGFSKERKIGSGSYGEVYLGVHQDGQKIAVKKIYDMPGVDDKQFQNELKNLTRLRHTNIVQLVGYCHDIQEVQVKYQGKLVIAEKINRALCLEYMPNGSLEKYISDECDKYDWHTGYGIINGICQGLKYLHTELNPPIYHLDLKPANVLLDENMVPRIADFGISRLFGDERTRATLSTLGTQGYLPPEYIRYNLISSKFDIFSLGVVIIKIMAGRSGYFNIADMSPQEFTNLVQEKWTNRLHETSNLMKAHSEQVKTCIEIGLRCVDDDRQRRPSIQDIVNRLHETETECAYAARKDRSSIYQEAIGNTLYRHAQYPNDRHSEQIYHRSTFKRDIVATAHFNYYKENAGPREARLDDESQFYGDDNQQYLAYGLGQHDPSMSQNGNTYYLPLGKNILNDQAPVSTRLTIPFHNFLSVPEDDMITDAVLGAEDVAGTSSDGVSLGTSSLSHVPVDMSSRSPSDDVLHKANNWKKSAYKKFDERESLRGQSLRGLTPDYFMNKNNGRPVREVPLNNDAGPSGQARTTWQYPNDMAAQHEFGDRRPLSVFSQAAILSNNDAGPSNQETLPFSQPAYGQTMHQGLGEHGPSIPQNGTPYCLPQGNILNDQGQFSAQSTIPPHNLSPVPQGDMITGASLTAQKEGTSSLDHVFADISRGLPSDQFQDYDLDLDATEYLADYDIPPANNATLQNPNSPVDGHGHDGGNQ